MLKVLNKKFRQRGVAIIEYAILLSLVAVIAVSFIGAGGLAKPINTIVENINNILNSSDQAARQSNSNEISLTSLKP